jgi:hypothetical protein
MNNSIELIRGKRPSHLPQRGWGGAIPKYYDLWAEVRVLPAGEWLGVRATDVGGRKPSNKIGTLQRSAKRRGLSDIQIVIENGLAFVRVTPPDITPMISCAPQPARTTAATQVTLTPASVPAPPKRNLREAKDPVLMSEEINVALDHLAKLEPGEVVELDLGPDIADWYRVFQKEAAATAVAKRLVVEIDRVGREMVVQLIKTK